MNQQPGLGRLEAKAYRSTWDDGMLDAFCGAGLLATGLFWLTDTAGLGAIPPALLACLWPAFRKRFTVPRLGLVTFREERRTTERRKLTLLALGGCVVFALGVGLYALRVREGAASSDWARTLVPGLPGVLLAILAIAGAALTGARRFSLYAALLIAGSGVSVLWRTEPGAYMAACGVVILVSGLALFTAFVRRHPIPPEAGQ